jgi:hypothetical protein
MRAIAIIVAALFVIGVRPVEGGDDVANKLHGRGN